jgi:hypothetical protein
MFCASAVNTFIFSVLFDSCLDGLLAHNIIGVRIYKELAPDHGGDESCESLRHPDELQIYVSGDR